MIQKGCFQGLFNRNRYPPIDRFLGAASACAWLRHIELLHRRQGGRLGPEPGMLTPALLFLLYRAAVLWFLPVPTASAIFWKMSVVRSDIFSPRPRG